MSDVLAEAVSSLFGNPKTGLVMPNHECGRVGLI
jgi:hypothetical protein